MSYRRPLPLLLAVFMVAVMLVLVFHWREQRRAAPPPVQSAPVAVPASPIDRARDGRKVQVTGTTSSSREVSDPDFGVAADGLLLLRRVEMRQWQERVDSTGAAVYVPVWSETLIDSSAFLDPGGHDNPARMPFESARFPADAVRLGDFLLGPEVLSRIGGAEEALPVGPEALPENLAASFASHEGVLHTGSDPESPEIGDLRVSFQRIPHQVITVVARQAGNRLEPFPPAEGDVQLEVRRGPPR